MPRNKPKPLLVIVGETASGKSALAIELAKEFNGEIIAADSRTVYKQLDIGTAKPTPAEQKTIRHHLIDVVEPGQSFAVTDFKRLANEAIDNIDSAGKLPILVGGSGLYIDSVLFDFKFGESGSERDPHNPRHRKKTTPQLADHTLRPNTLIIGLVNSRENLKQRISERVKTMFKNGLIEEAKRLGKEYGWDTPALQAPAYRAMRQYLENKVTLQEAKALFIKYDLDLAKRQRTWFKRNKNIHWTYDQAQVFTLVRSFLNKQHI